MSGKKTTMATRVATPDDVQSEPEAFSTTVLRPLHVKTPEVALTASTCGSNSEYETMSLLSPDVRNEDNWRQHLDKHGYLTTSQWQVLGDISCFQYKSVQVVHLRQANYGLRWAYTTTPSRFTHPRRHEDEAPTCVVGPHWWFMSIAFSVFFLAALIVTVLTLPAAGLGEAVTGILLSTACLSMYAMVGCTNPGIVERTLDPPDDTYTFCDHCESYRPEGALHCLDCRACIEEYDHHCPWTGKCIGKRNVRYFYAWLFFLVLAFVYEMIEFTTYMLPPEDQPRSFSDMENEREIHGDGGGFTQHLRGE
ncbi:hypothetical protein Poli38472_010713 [Pythium oligandrum]|uniref:Palmitoyltransferase n=1 Tax=Pythium oligandrum TaxID=41045 RepID=A0A8K1FFH1_PYTOL|nr:hypothetical protein Poli38472_010713 [Pythium oligandrum]|eukprot:TMW61650.1 hypothetical protein Poli38472_010713 [Pythium oligandrum]